MENTENNQPVTGEETRKKISLQEAMKQKLAASKSAGGKGAHNSAHNAKINQNLKNQPAKKKSTTRMRKGV